jgi:hypothetical protein
MIDMAKKTSKQAHADERQPRRTFLRRVAAISLIEAYARMDEMGQSTYDMMQIYFGPCEDREGYIEVLIWGWENDSSREHLDV